MPPSASASDLPAPRLTWWGHVWRVLVMLLLSLVVWAPSAGAQLDRSLALTVVDVVLGLAAYVLVFLRRRWPVGIAVATALLATVSGTAAGAAVLAVVSMSTRRRWREIVPVALLNVATGAVFMALYPTSSEESFWLALSANVIATAAMVAWGLYIGSRRELLWTLRQRAERAEAEQELRAGQARATERARIAREMHDVLAHRITQISMRAGALGFRDDLTSQELRDGVQVIQQQANEALTDLRDVLGVLREGAAPGDPATAPQPTYADLPGLVEEAREGGLNVVLVDDLDSTAVPDPIGRAVYRIVQEGMTNARKHAPGAALRIRLSGGPEDGLCLHLDNPLGFRTSGTPGSGLGLVGLAERAALLGGRLEHRRERAAFVVDTWIPWPA